MIDKTASQENEADSNTNDDITTEQNNVMPSVSPTVVDLEIQDIEGVGPTTTKKLKEAGIISVMDLAVATADDLSVDINSSKETAATFIMAAQRLLRESNILEKEFVTAESALEKRKALMRCSTGSRALDELLLGGI
jgi:DNA repair protein RadA